MPAHAAAHAHAHAHGSSRPCTWCTGGAARTQTRASPSARAPPRRRCCRARMAPESGEQVREELLVVLLAHRRELRVAASDEPLECRGPHALLEDRWRCCLGTGCARGRCALLRRHVPCCAPWVRVPARQQPTDELVYLAVEAGSRKGHDAGGQVFHCYRGGLVLLEGREGEEDLDN